MKPTSKENTIPAFQQLLSFNVPLGPLGVMAGICEPSTEGTEEE